MSGGPDSITLLDVLLKIQKEIKFNVVVAHVNHMIRKEARARSGVCREVLQKKKYSLFCT